MQKIIIAIDGYAATGKSTQAKRLAQHLNYTYIDSGAMYRAVTYFALENNFCTTSQEHWNPQPLVAALGQLQLEMRFEDGQTVVLLDGEDVTPALRDHRVAQWVSTVAAVPEVRHFLVAEQQRIGRAKGIVMDGRDIGTVVFPEAELKFFFTADAKIRAQRRFEELQNVQPNLTFEAVLKNVVQRDQQDASRAVSPLRKADDAITIDVSQLSIDATFDKILATLNTGG
jgi:cytidylate kinase